LVTAGLQPTEWGGDVELVRCSALTGQGIDQLLETLLTIAELHDYRANPERPAHGTCLEASLHEGRGVVAKVLVQNGTLNVGDIIVCGPAFGRIKSMQDTLDLSKQYESVGPSTPVNVTGLDITPGAGDHFYELNDVAIARDIAEKRKRISRETALGGALGHVTLETLHDRLASSDKVQNLNLVLRADVRGSIEAIQKELGKLTHDEVQIKVLQATVGGITEADVHLADASDAIIIGFNVVPDEKARALADSLGVQIRRYDIIYQVTDDLKAALEGMLKPERREVDLGRALVQKTFSISRVGTIAGCRVIGGTIERNGRVRLIRDGRVIGDYPLESLKREKDDAREVREGLECGIKLGGFNDLKEGDILEVYRIEEVARTL
jgi:translation initiation factor IF-2